MTAEQDLRTHGLIERAEFLRDTSARQPTSTIKRKDKRS
jgi:hypothetical protein